MSNNVHTSLLVTGLSLDVAQYGMYVGMYTQTGWGKRIYICMIRRLDLQLLSMTSDDEEKEIVM